MVLFALRLITCQTAYVTVALLVCDRERPDAATIKHMAPAIQANIHSPPEQAAARGRFRALIHLVIETELKSDERLIHPPIQPCNESYPPAQLTGVTCEM